MSVAESSEGLQVSLRCVAPANAIIYTTNQSVPTRDNKATRSVHADGLPLVLPLGRDTGEAHHVHAMALGPDLLPSDLVAVSAPKESSITVTGPAGSGSASSDKCSQQTSDRALKKLKGSDKRSGLLRDFQEGML